MAGWSLIRSRWVKWAARVVPIIGLAVLAAVTHVATGSAAEFRAGLLSIVALAAVAVIVPVALDQGGPVARVLALRPLVWLGVMSYGVYLCIGRSSWRSTENAPAGPVTAFSPPAAW